MSTEIICLIQLVARLIANQSIEPGRLIYIYVIYIYIVYVRVTGRNGLWPDATLFPSVIDPHKVLSRSDKMQRILIADMEPIDEC